MPIYEFKCRQCGKDFEFLCFRSDEAENVECPSCGGKKADRLLSCFSSSRPVGRVGRVGDSGSCSPTGGFS